jgi:nucleoside triphosphate diphosphatase
MSSGIDELLAVMRRLRDPDGGCPWDLEQTFATIAPYTIEEAYEVADAILREDWGDLEGELGDLLLQVVYHARIAQERGLFDFDRVARGIAAKMVARHPHIFADGEGQTAESLRVVWEDAKERERRRKAEAAEGGGDASALADIPRALPALTRAVKLQKRAARVGFDWTEAGPILAKLREELGELEAAHAAGDPAATEAELGDLLFTVANLARRLDVDPEAALRGTNARFEARFRRMEALAGERGRALKELDLEEQDALWDEAKALERQGGG